MLQLLQRVHTPLREKVERVALNTNCAEIDLRWQQKKN